MLRAEFSLPSITAEDAAPERKAPIRVKFEIPYFTVSGIQVRVLNYVIYPDGDLNFSIFLSQFRMTIECKNRIQDGCSGKKGLD